MISSMLPRYVDRSHFIIDSKTDMLLLLMQQYLESEMLTALSASDAMDLLG